jgi:hypothetical protein
MPPVWSAVTVVGAAIVAGTFAHRAYTASHAANLQRPDARGAWLVENLWWIIGFGVLGFILLVLAVVWATLLLRHS